MQSTATIPVTIEPDVGPLLDALGVRAAFDRILRHTLEEFTELAALRVRVYPHYDTEEGESIMFEMIWPDSRFMDSDTHARWMDWLVASFPMSVGRWFRLSI